MATQSQLPKTWTDYSNRGMTFLDTRRNGTGGNAPSAVNGMEYDWASLIPGFAQQLWGRNLVGNELQGFTDVAAKNGLTPEQLQLFMSRSTPETLAYATQQNTQQQPPALPDTRAQRISPEYITGLLGAPTAGAWQDQARRDSFGINIMPSVFSAYGDPALATSQLGNAYAPGNQMTTGLIQNLLTSGTFNPVEQQIGDSAALQGILGELNKKPKSKS